MRLSRMSIVLAAETSQFSADINAAKRTVEIYAKDSARQFERVEKKIDKLREATGMSREEYEKLKNTLREQTALATAANAIHKMGIEAGYSASEIAKLQRSAGIFQRVEKGIGGIKGQLSEAGKDQALYNRFRQDNNAASALEGTLQRLKILIAGYIGLDALRGVARTSVDLASMQKTFYALTGSMEGARAEIAWLREESQRLGLDFFALTESFKGFSAAGTAAGMEASQVRAIFTSVTEASTVLGLNAQKTKLALYALEQMLSKGSVTMEELRRQLGDQLPGAFQLAAKAMNMSTEELGKLIKTGNLSSQEFLPKFAAVLREHYGPGLAEAMKTPRAELQRLVNAITFAQAEIGEGGFLQGLASAAKELSAALQTDEMKAQLNQLGYALGNITGLLGKLAVLGVQNSHTILSLAAGFGATSLAVRKLNPLLMSYNAALRSTDITMKSVAVSARAFGASLMGALTSPAAMATYLATSIVYLATRQSRAEQIAVTYADAIARVKGEFWAAGEAAKHLSEEQKNAAVNAGFNKLEEAKESLAALREEMENMASGSKVNFWSAPMMDPEVNKLFAAAADGTITMEKLYSELNRVQIAMRQAGEGSKAFHSTLSSWIKLAGDAFGVETVIRETEKTIQDLKDGTVKAGESAEDAAEKYMKLDAALKSVAKLTAQYNSITLNPKDFSFFGLQKEIEDYDRAIMSLVENGKKAEASVAAMQLNILQAGAMGAEAGSLQDWLKERKFFADEIKKIETGQTEHSKQQAETRYNLVLAGLTLEREAIGREIELAKVRRESVAGLLENLNKVNTLISGMEQNREKLQAAESIKKQFDDAKRALQEFEREYQRILGGTAKETSASIRAEMDLFRDAAKSAYDSATISAEEYASVLTRIQELEDKRQGSLKAQNPVWAGTEERRDRLAQGEGDFGDVLTVGLGGLVKDYKNVFDELAGISENFFQGFSSGFGDSVGRALIYGESFKEVMGESMRSLLAQTVSQLTEMGMQWVVNKVLMQTYSKAAQTEKTTMETQDSVMRGKRIIENKAEMATIAADSAPAAGMVSLATMGAAAAAAIAGIIAVMAMTRGFKSGGYTGAGNPNDPAGIVHRGEFVMPKPVVDRVGIGTLESIASGRAFEPPFAFSGRATGGTPQLTVNIENTGTVKDFTVQPISADEVRIIARDEVRRETPQIMVNETVNPNSRYSKTLSRKTTVGRRR